MFADRKPKFRSRKLETSRLLEVYRYDQVDDVDDFDGPSRAVVQVATGVDKEEEDELHLQRALKGQQGATVDKGPGEGAAAAATAEGAAGAAYYIPTPECAQIVPDYEQLYPKSFKLPSKAFVKGSTLLSDEAFGSIARYNVDDVDIQFIAKINRQYGLLGEGAGERGAPRKSAAAATPRKGAPAAAEAAAGGGQLLTVTMYEHIVDCLEDAAHKVSDHVAGVESLCTIAEPYRQAIFGADVAPSVGSAQLSCQPFIKDIIAFWRSRRVNDGRCLLHLVYEDCGKVGADPYVCFRRRQLKMPRKTRRSDAQITERLRKVHFDIATLKTLLQATIKRDLYKEQALICEASLFDRYCRIAAFCKATSTSWPAHIPSFKVAAQSLLESRSGLLPSSAGAAGGALGKRDRSAQGAGRATGSDGGRLDRDGNAIGGDGRSHHRGGSGRTAHSAASSSMPLGCKIAIPLAAIKGSSPYTLPYYPADVARLIQKDCEGLFSSLGLALPSPAGSSPSLPLRRHHRDEEPLLLPRQGHEDAHSFLARQSFADFATAAVACEQSPLLLDEGRPIGSGMAVCPSPHIGERRRETGDFASIFEEDGCAGGLLRCTPHSVRRGRGGRLIIDRARRSLAHLAYEPRVPLMAARGGCGPGGRLRMAVDGMSAECIADQSTMPFSNQFHNALLGPKDFTQLQTPLGNYNVHAVQTANQIQRPMSFQAWIASTAPIVQGLTAAANGARTKSPRKKKAKSAKDSASSSGGTASQISTVKDARRDVPGSAESASLTTADASAAGGSRERGGSLPSASSHVAAAAGASAGGPGDTDSSRTSSGRALEISQLRTSNQITVKVNKPQDGGSLHGIAGGVTQSNISSSNSSSTKETPRKPSTGTTGALFTLNGLAPPPPAPPSGGGGGGGENGEVGAKGGGHAAPVREMAPSDTLK